MKTALNTMAWTSLCASLIFNWAVITHRVELPGQDYLSTITEARLFPQPLPRRR